MFNGQGEQKQSDITMTNSGYIYMENCLVAHSVIQSLLNTVHTCAQGIVFSCGWGGEVLLLNKDFIFFSAKKGE